MIMSMMFSLSFLKPIYMSIPTLSLIMMYMIMKSSELMFISINNIFFLDKLSFIMILLSIMSSMLILLTSNMFLEISTLIMIILFLLIMTFSSMNLFMFYIMFEIILIPTLLLITKTGNQPERLQAGMYLILYTISASLPLLIGILSMKTNYNMIYSLNSCFMAEYPIIFIMAFLVKMPMFIFHLWLPKAHVEAPLEGSMILAAILLKLGGYGLIRIIPLLMKIKTMSPWIISISLMGAMMTSMNCIRQKDLKSLIAYSSVAHMGLILVSLFTLTKLGMKGAIIMMIAHGLASSALFLLVNVMYTKFHTRNILSFKGAMKMFPNLSFWWFIFVAINISAPPSINLLSELFMLTSMIFWEPYMMMMLIILSSFFASIFSINLFMGLSHNKPEMMTLEEVPSKMYLSLLVHFIPLIMISLKLEIM